MLLEFLALKSAIWLAVVPPFAGQFGKLFEAVNAPLAPLHTAKGVPVADKRPVILGDLNRKTQNIKNQSLIQGVRLYLLLCLAQYSFN
jgi:hypothetical protein